MINVSSEFREALKNDNRDYYEYATITLEDGTVLNLTNENFWQNGFEKEDAVSSDDELQIGSAIINKANIVLNNIYEDFDDYDFLNATIVLQIGLKLENGIEKIKLGEYTVVDQPKYNGSLISVEMLDNMYLFDKPYSMSNLKYPATLDTIVRDACSVLDVTLDTLNFPHKDYVVETRPDDDITTFRQVISMAAQIAGCFAKINPNGNLVIAWYDRDALDEAKTKDDISGVHYINSLYSEDISVDDVVITGVRVSVDVEIETTENGHISTSTETVSYLYGTEGYVINIEGNDFITSATMVTVATWIGIQVVGLQYRKASVTHSSDPSMEAGDVAVVIDRKSKRQPIFVSRTNFQVGSAQTTVSAAKIPSRNSATRYSLETKNIVSLRKRIVQEKNDREQIEADLQDAIENANGLYETQVEQEDGGVITYMHNKPLLADSDIQIMISTAGVTVTPNGTSQNPTWYGLTVDGNLIANILSATGIHADWINTGQLVVKKGNAEVMFVDVDTGVVRISGNSISITAGDPISEAISAAEQSANDYTNQQMATAGGYTLETPFTWDAAETTATFSAIIYKGTEDVTDSYDAAQFVWTLRTENGETRLGTGKSISVSKSSMGYGATVTCTFTDYANTNAALLTRSNMALLNASGDTLTMLTQSEGEIRVVDLPVKKASEVNLDDYLMGIDAADGYQVTISDLASAMATGVFDTRYVKKSGDTMTGNLTINKSSGALYLKSTNINSKVGETIPSSNTALGSLHIQDNQGVSSYSQVFKTTDDQLYWSMIVSRYMGDTLVRHGFYQRIYADGTKTVTFYDTASRDAWANGLNVVKKAGDTMTGNLVIQKPGAAISLRATNATIGTVPSSNAYPANYFLQDSAGTNIGYFRAAFMSNGRTGVGFETARKVNGTNVYNGLTLFIDESGTRSVGVADASIWRTALGLSNVDNTYTSTTTIADIITVNSYNATITSASYTRYGKIAQVHIVWTNKNAISVPANGNFANVTIGTLVSGKRPHQACVAHSHGDNAGAAWYNIETGGAIGLGACEGTGTARTIAAGTTFWCDAVFIL